MIRAVFDTGVVVSSLLFRSGPAARLRAHWSSGRVEALVCPATTKELLRVLAYPKFALSEREIESLLSEYLPWTVSFHLPATADPRLPRCRDAADQVFLELAAAGAAAVVVTGDRDLLTLAGRAPFAIETVAACLERFGTSR